MKKSLLKPFLAAILMVVSVLCVSSCKKDTPVGDITELPGRVINNFCYICNRELTPAPTGVPIPPEPPYDPTGSTPYYCYHEYAAGETCPFVYCNLYPRHHFHLFYVGYTHNTTGQIHEHIGGGGD